MSNVPPVTLVLLDRDGVITQPVLDPLSGTHESPLSPADTRLVPGAADAIATLQRAGVAVAVVSNQPAAAKGRVPAAQLASVHDRTVELLAAVGVQVTDWGYCPHHPAGVVRELTARCDCRKPAPGLLLAAISRAGADAAGVWMVGDADSDVAAGRTAGVHTALVDHPLTSHRRQGRADAVAGEGTTVADLAVADLGAFVDWLDERVRTARA